MGFLDKIRGARKAAEEHQKKTVEQQQQTATPPPKQTYRHKPTHAAQDALTCMGGGVNDDLRDRIREQHKRRSKLTVSASHASLSSCSQLSGQRGYRKARESIAPNSPRDLSPGLGNDSVALRRGSIQPMSSSASGPVDQDDGNESLCGYFSSVQPNRQPSYTYTSATQQHRAYFSHPSSPGSLTRSRVPLAIAPTESSVDESVEYSESHDHSSKSSVSSQTSVSSRYSEQGLEMKTSLTPRQRELYDLLLDKPSKIPPPTSPLPSLPHPSIERVKSTETLRQPLAGGARGSSAGRPRARSPLGENRPAVTRAK